MKNILRKNKGFTVIELAIVIIIIGLIIGIGAGMIGPLTKKIKRDETKEIINADVESLIGFASSIRRLPTVAEFSNSVRNPNDSFSKPLYYIVEPNLTAIPSGTSDAICGRRTTSYTICRDAACTAATNIQNAAFIVASGADNSNLQTGILSGGVCPTGQTCVRIYETDTPNIDECTTAVNCPNYPAALLIDRPEAYDDLVKWVTLSELRTKVGCQGTQLKIVNNELPYGRVGNLYSNVVIYGDGGIPFPSGGNYKWCIKGTMPTGIANPTTGCPATTSCASLGGEGEWLQASNLIISGTPTAAGSYSINVLLRDNNDSDINQSIDNCAQKTFVITISP